MINLTQDLYFHVRCGISILLVCQDRMTDSRVNDLFALLNDFDSSETAFFLVNAQSYDRASFIPYALANSINTANVFLVSVDKVTHVHKKLFHLT